MTGGSSSDDLVSWMFRSPWTVPIWITVPRNSPEAVFRTEVWLSEGRGRALSLSSTDLAAMHASLKKKLTKKVVRPRRKAATAP